MGRRCDSAFLAILISACACAAAGASLPAAPAAAAKAPAGHAAATAAEVADSVVAELNRARVSRGAAPLSRPDALQKAAEQRAQDVAAMPYEQRMNRSPRLGEFLRRRGITRFAEARERFMMLGGYDDPAAQVLSSWKDYDEAWSAAMSPRAAQVGIGWTLAGDGSWVFLAIFLEPLREYDAARIASMERGAFDAVNRERASHGLPALAWSDALAAVARGHSEDMAARHYFDHVTPDGLSPADRLRAAGLSYRRASENIARNQGVEDPVAAAVSGWMRSAGHRANILDPVPTSSGLGIAVDDAGMAWFTQVFFAPP
jgi:uncharacterized protein YkwD